MCIQLLHQTELYFLKLRLLGFELDQHSKLDRRVRRVDLCLLGFIYGTSLVYLCLLRFIYGTSRECLIFQCKHDFFANLSIVLIFHWEKISRELLMNFSWAHGAWVRSEELLVLWVRC